MTDLDERIARVCHEANRALQMVFYDPAVGVGPGWDLLGVDDREVVIQGVYAARIGEAGPAESHEAWCEAKIAQGWTLGEVKNSVLKTHPCLVPYDELPPIHRLKDQLFLAIVDVLQDAALASGDA